MSDAALDHASEADRIIAELGLVPHPEGGYFRETFRDAEPAGERGHSTAIYFLLKDGQVSRWHRVDAVEMWHWYAGSPLALSIAAEAGTGLTTLHLGGAILAGERPQAVVPKNWWQSARTLGAWTLVGCTVSPAFEFAGFELSTDDFEPERT